MHDLIKILTWGVFVVGSFIWIFGGDVKAKKRDEKIQTFLLDIP
jgi:hypothetical protein